MRNVPLVLLFLVLPHQVLASPEEGWIQLAGATAPVPATVTARDMDGGAVDIDVEIPGLVRREVITRHGRFLSLGLVDGGVQGEIGRPQLPILRLLVAIPYGGRPVLSVRTEDVATATFQDLGLDAPLMPVQPPVEKIPGALERAPFVMDEAAYRTDAFQLPAMVSLGDEGVIRGHRFVTLLVSPVDINPVREEARILGAVSVRIEVEGADLALTTERAQRYACREFDAIKRRLFVNPPSDTRDLNGLPNPPKLLIITEPSWATNANLLAHVDWKRAKGFRPELVTTSTTGSTNTAIKAYIQNAYDTWPIPPTAVLLVGDTGGIPHWVGIGANNPATDLNYTMLEGSDYFPDIEIGRWSVTNATQLNNIATKSLSYEQVGWSGNNTWEKYVVYMASEDNYSITEGTHNYVHSTYLQPDGYSCDKLYCHTYNATTQQVRDSHNAGRSLSIYSGHGAETYWADGPPFYQSDVNNLVNTVYPFVQSYACLTGNYTVAECFSETWIRATRGAIGMMASSVTSYWTEDDILEKRVMEGFCANVNAGEENQTWTGGMMNYGKLRYYQYFGNTSTTRRYFEMYNIMGDATIDLWTAVPTPLSVSHPSALPIGSTTFNVTVTGFPDWALVCARDGNGQVYATSYLFSGGTATLNLGSGPTSPGTLYVTVTGHDCQPYQASIPIIAPSGPYLVVSNVTTAEAPGGNGNGQADFGEGVLFSLTLQNVGTSAAYGVNAQIATSDPYFTLTDNSASYGTIPAGGQVTVPNGFAGTIAASVADGREISFTVTMTDNVPTTWTGSFAVTAHAPSVAVGSVTVSDPTGNNNGRLDPGESATLNVTLTNSGGAPVSSVVATLSSPDPYITITDNSENVGTIAAGGSAVAVFGVTASPSTPVGHSAPFTVQVAGTNYTTSGGFSLTIGLVIEDFETGTFTQFPWVMGGNLPWTITGTNPYEGAFCARSGAITHSQTSDLSVKIAVLQPGTISFWYRVSSESNYDFLRFFIDGVQQGQWSGEVPWSQATYSVSAGNHTFLWRYLKDGSLSSGSDCAWIDYIVFPSVAPPPMPDIGVSPMAIEASVPVGESTQRTITVANTGAADLTYAVTVTTNSRQASSEPPVKLGKDEVDTHVGSAPDKASGGPDGFGYVWIDSDSPSGPTYSWVDISGVGSVLPTGDDYTGGPFDLGFAFPFYGSTYTQVRICTNGWMSFTSTSTAHLNQGIPNTGEPNALLAPFWDDLDTRSSGSIRYWADTANNRFIVSWLQVPHYASTGSGTYTFQVILHADGRIVYQYHTLVGLLTSCTVGIENETGADGLQVVSNADYLHNGLAIQFARPQPWLTVVPLGGTVGPGGNAQLTVTMDAADLSEGTYTGTITISSNDPDEGSLGIPVTFHVGPIGSPSLTVTPLGNSVQLSWTSVGSAAAYWVYGASNQAYFEPGMAPGYAYRLAVLPPGTTTWSSSAGVGDPDANWTYLVIAVDGSGAELARSNRAGEFDVALP